MGEKKPVVADEDYALVALCQEGDVETFGALVEKHQKRMLNIAYRMIGDYEASCEVVQDAFVSAHRAIKKFRGEAKFSTWLLSIVINLSNNRMKQSETLPRPSRAAFLAPNRTHYFYKG